MSNFSSILSLIKQSQLQNNGFLLLVFSKNNKCFLSFLYREGLIKGFSQIYLGKKLFVSNFFFSNFLINPFLDIRFSKKMLNKQFYLLLNSGSSFLFSCFKLVVFLKYFDQNPVIRGFFCFNSTSFYWSYSKLVFFYSNNFSFTGFGVIVLSTSFGLLSIKDALKLGVGGKVLFEIF